MNFYPANPILNVPIIWFISCYHIKYEWGGGLNCAASSLLIVYYKFIPRACLSLGKFLSFVLCFRTMHDLLSCLNFLLVFFFFFSLREETNKLLALEVYFSYKKKMQVNLISLIDLISCVIIQILRPALLTNIIDKFIL